jgi:hypothetical protein
MDEKVLLVVKILKCSPNWTRASTTVCSVPDPQVFGPSGSVDGSGSFLQLEIKLRKTLIETNFYMTSVGYLKATAEKSRIRIRNPWSRIRLKCH